MIGSRRGTSNSNARGSSKDRRRRKEWLLETFDTDLGPDVCRCPLCGVMLTYDRMEVDRILPGALGGTYVRSNIRPICPPCNLERGHALQREIHESTCFGRCRRCRLVEEFRLWRAHLEADREYVTIGYATEMREYGPLPTFRDYLIMTAEGYYE